MQWATASFDLIFFHLIYYHIYFIKICLSNFIYFHSFIVRQSSGIWSYKSIHLMIEIFKREKTQLSERHVISLVNITNAQLCQPSFILACNRNGSVFSWYRRIRIITSLMKRFHTSKNVPSEGRSRTDCDCLSRCSQELCLIPLLEKILMPSRITDKKEKRL